MKLTNIDNVESFFEVVNQCTGTVELVTGEGDRLNLKSKLCQLISMTNIFSNTNVASIPELEIIAHEPEDVSRLLNFMMKGN